MDRLFEVPFDSETKRRILAIRRPNDMVRIYVNGASDVLLRLSKYYVNGDGRMAELDAISTAAPAEMFCSANEQQGLTNRQMIEKTIEYFARKAYRTIIFCYKDVTH